MNHRLMIILLLALIPRLIISPFFGHPWDMYIWLKSGELALANINIYLLENPVDYPWGFYAYPPTWLYWLIIPAIINKIIENLYITIFLIKLPIIISDILAGFLIYRIALRLGYGDRKALIISAIWLFNPITFFISSVWGMFDSIAVFFMLTALSSILDEKYARAGLLIGIGASVKLLPALLIPPTVIYLLKARRLEKKKIFINLFMLPALIFLLVSLPFLSTPIEYLKHILQHAESVGSFTYWVALSAIVNPSIFWFLPLIVYVAVITISYKKFQDGVYEYIKITGGTILSFLAASPKVNIQHTLIFIPLILLYNKFLERGEIVHKFTWFMLAGVVWLSSSLTILYNYSIEYVGKVYTPDSYDFGLGAVMLVVSSVVGGVCIVRLTLDVLGLNKVEYKMFTSRWGMIAIILSALLVFSLYSSPSGVIIPMAEIRIGIPESVDSAFIPKSATSIDNYLKHYNVNYVVLPWSPDFVNTYRGLNPNQDITIYTRFRTGSNKWSQSDIIWLVNEFHSRGVKVLLGVYLKVEEIKPHYGMQGYSIDWIKNHGEVIGSEGILLFNKTIHIDESRSYPYSEYFANQITRIVRDIGFDGVYLMSWSDWRSSGGSSHILPLLSELKKKLDKPLFIEGPENTDNPEEVINLLELSDYVILKTAPWVYTVYYARTDNVTLTDYKKYIQDILSRIDEDDEEKLLFSLYLFDFVDGWTTPATQVFIEAREFYESGLRKGYALYYTSRYVPYRVSFEINYQATR
ncbi:MAG: PIG-U family protein [Nitrososphaeria archaeon]|nr:PIG-U family protein [Nitrososphaeria archaeon]